MDTTTLFIDTLSQLASELQDLKKRINKLDKELNPICATLAKGDVRDRETRVSKLCSAKEATEYLQNFISYAVESRIFKFCGSLETLHTMLDQNDNEIWRVLETNEKLSAPQAVDRLTDAITDYLLSHHGQTPSPKSLFNDNPDNYVADFVASYLDHPISDRMSDMVISLVSDWISFRLQN